jgi:hypothetical protein
MFSSTIPALQAVRFAAVFVALVFLAVRPAAAGDSGAWTLIESAGAVHITQPGIRPVSLTTGDLVGPGQRISTDGDGRAVLRRGENTIVVSPNSVLEVPTQNTDLMTRIRHVMGTLLFDVEKRKEQHFEVLTPDVAVVVKGTTFTTSISSRGAVVHVISGLVQVADIRSGQTVFVRPGQTAVGPKGGGRVDIQGNPAGTPEPNQQSAPATDGDQADSGSQGKGNKGGVKIASAISGQTLSLGQLSDGLLRQDGAPGRGIGRNPFGNETGSFTNPGGNIPKGLAKKDGWTPPGLIKADGSSPGNSAFGHSQGGGNSSKPACPGNSCNAPGKNK